MNRDQCREAQIRTAAVVVGIELLLAVVGFGAFDMIQTSFRPSLNQANIPGTYKGNYGNYDGETEILILRAGGTYSETFLFPSGNAYQNAGHWSYSESDRRSYVLIENAFVGLQIEPPRRANWRLAAMGPAFGLIGSSRLELDAPESGVALSRIAEGQTSKE